MLAHSPVTKVILLPRKLSNFQTKIFVPTSKSWFFTQRKKSFFLPEKLTKENLSYDYQKMLSLKQKFWYFSEKLTYTFMRKLKFFILDMFWLGLGLAVFYFTKLLRVLTKNFSHSVLVKWFSFSIFYVSSILK